MPARRPLRSSFPHGKQSLTETIPRRVCVRRLGLTGGHMANRPPVRLLLLGIRAAVVVCSSGRMGEARPSFRQPRQCGCPSALWKMCDQKGKPRGPISPHHRHVVRLVSTHDTPGCTACSSSISQLWQNSECAPAIWPSAPSILAICPLSFSARRASNDQAQFGDLLPAYHGVSDAEIQTDAWVTTTTLLLGTVGSRFPPPQARRAEDYHNGSPSNGTSLATTRLQTQGNCPSWGVCFPPPTHPRVPCNRFKIGKPLSRLSTSGTHCASPAVFWCWTQFHPPCMPFCFQP